MDGFREWLIDQVQAASRRLKFVFWDEYKYIYRYVHIYIPWDPKTGKFLDIPEVSGNLLKQGKSAVRLAECSELSSVI